MQADDPLTITLRKFVEVFMRRSMHNFISSTRESGLSMSQVGALFFLHRGSRTVSDIGDVLGVSNAASSQMLERLVQQGLILRSEDPHDRRVKQIVLTDQGRQVIRESIAARQGWLDGLANSLSAAEKEQVISALNLLIDKANQLEQRPEPVV